MTTPCRGSLGTDMKKIALLLLSLVLLLSSCSGLRSFERDTEGYGYTDQKSDLYYVELDAAFEPAKTGDAFGEYENKKTGTKRTFSVIPDLDPALFLTDEYLNVYYAGETPLDAAKWEPSAILVCNEDVISVEEFRFTTEKDAATVAIIRSLWFEGAGDAVLPFSDAAYKRRLKISCDAYPNLFYCFSFLVYDSGEAYFYDASSRRTVAVPDTLVALLRPAKAEEG